MTVFALAPGESHLHRRRGTESSFYEEEPVHPSEHELDDMNQYFRAAPENFGWPFIVFAVVCVTVLYLQIIWVVRSIPWPQM